MGKTVSFYLRKINSRPYRNKAFIQDLPNDKQLEKINLFRDCPLFLRVISKKGTELSVMGDINSNSPFYCPPLSLLMLQFTPHVHLLRNAQFIGVPPKRRQVTRL